ncbi:lysophospholipase [Roseiconus nitratireducens]|uniref:Lysophospholipase n=1 Tax=Roseiconus nitratireducens TaxID=2605748 RepID=A0A5M6D0Q6_9BACT|nr:alpha/beta fold hydrolase [Roseiconus nitratireducens]KAA5541088.1 lysophospholipase [Roseiconus nitratireducens]
MITSSVQLKGSPGVYARLWSGDDRAPAGIAILMHGLGDHGGRHQSFARRLVARRWGVLAIDLPGHGRSTGRRGTVSSYDALMRMIASARRAMSQRFPGIHQVVIGHSMGGNLAINYALRRSEFDSHAAEPLNGLVLVAPMLMPPAFLDRQRVFAAWGTGQLLRWVRVSKAPPIDQLTRDQAMARRIEADPLQHHHISLYLATQLLAQGRFALDHAAQIGTRTLVLYGDEDQLIDRAACRNLVLRMRGHGELICWRGGRHDLINDIDADRVVGRLADWMDRKRSRGQRPVTAVPLAA